MKGIPGQQESIAMPNSTQGLNQYDIWNKSGRHNLSSFLEQVCPVRSISEGYPGPMTQLEPEEYHIHLGSLVLLSERAYKRWGRVSILLVSQRLLAGPYLHRYHLIYRSVLSSIVVVHPASYTISD